MHTNVPQYIDVEDKIAFGLTAKQLLWMGAMVAVLVVAYSLFDRQLFFGVAIFMVVIFGTLAFWKPQGVTLITFLGFILQYFSKPRNYIWKRIYSAKGVDIKKAMLVQKKQIGPAPREKKLPTGRQLQKIAWILDTEGKVRNQ